MLSKAQAMQITNILKTIVMSRLRQKLKDGLLLRKTLSYMRSRGKGSGDIALNTATKALTKYKSIFC